MYQDNATVMKEIAHILSMGVEPNSYSGKAMIDTASIYISTTSTPLDFAAAHLKAVNDQIAKATLSSVDSGFVFGRKSEAELIGVKVELVDVSRLALKLSTIDFTLYDGLRTPEEQRAYLARGTTTTLKSKHLKQSDGFGWAVDAVPVINGLPKWDWEGCYRIALAFDQAATHLGHADNIRWGGAWDRTLADFGSDVESYKKEVLGYQARHPGKDFVDGPHYEWVQ